MTKRSLPGWLGAFFGSLGTLICLGSLVFVWIHSFQLRDSVGQVFSRVSAVLTQVQDGSETIATRIDLSRQNIHELDRRIEGAIVELAENAAVEREELDELTGHALVIGQRMQDWLAFAKSAREVSELAEEIIQSTVIFFRADDRTMGSIRTSLKNGQQQIEEAITAFDELTVLLETARESRTDEDFSKRAEPLLIRIDTALELVQEHTTSFTAEVALLEERSRDLGTSIRRWIFFGAVLISLLIVWQGAGQVCLARSGWARIRWVHPPPPGSAS